ncbi:GNAT family N-acetyltransferase [Sphingomonas psychrotolerans]|uniref:GNAT family N-acetyltransferase n=1 Tax=Sphingomonas psychrotolerans TaxID=1327635 RepID=A0A2K8MF56_9SPHN|nr:N-acetyltransferase [Sphingomonas psychrotolerans]ATY32503.1 GNAT family N-acetyltransferase [Sphingomonas psychrotolerans]
MSIAIRPATGGDVAAIDALLRKAFPDAGEAMLVQRLCVDGDMVLTLVADDEETGSLAGVIAYSRMAVAIGDKPIAAVALAPLAVDAGQRGQGVAEALVRASLTQLADAGAMLVFVLGDPAYYERFGFSADWARGFASPYVGDYLMALPLQGGAMPCGERGAATHAKAFAQLGGEI